MTEQSETVGDSSRPQLSRLDVEILRLVAEGRPFGEIGMLVGFSQRTAYRRIQRLMTLLGARDRADLVAKAEEKRLI